MEIWDEARGPGFSPQNERLLGRLPTKKLVFFLTAAGGAAEAAKKQHTYSNGNDYREDRSERK
jgi:hypothetical protein